MKSLECWSLGSTSQGAGLDGVAFHGVSDGFHVIQVLNGVVEGLSCGCHLDEHEMIRISVHLLGLASEKPREQTANINKPIPKKVFRLAKNLSQKSTKGPFSWQKIKQPNTFGETKIIKTSRSPRRPKHPKHRRHLREPSRGLKRKQAQPATKSRRGRTWRAVQPVDAKELVDMNLFWINRELLLSNIFFFKAA